MTPLPLLNREDVPTSGSITPRRRRTSDVPLETVVEQLEAEPGRAQLRGPVARFNLQETKGEYQVLGWVV